MEEDKVLLDDTQDDVVDHHDKVEEQYEDGLEEDTFEPEEDEEEEELEDEEESEENQDVADPEQSEDIEPAPKKQSKDENAIYAKMRRKAEAEAKAKYEAEMQKIQEERMRLEQMHAEKNILENALNPRAVWDKANEEGVSEDVAIRLIRAEAQEQIQKEKEAVRERFERKQREKAELRNQKYFNELESDVDQMLEINPNLDVRTAFHYLRGQKMDELLSNSSKNIEKRTIANIHDRARRRNISDSEGVADMSTKQLSDVGRKAALFMGVDPRDVAKHVQDKLKNSKRR